MVLDKKKKRGNKQGWERKIKPKMTLKMQIVITFVMGVPQIFYGCDPLSGQPESSQ